jgi:uroporphyrinogen-III synthase
VSVDRVLLTRSPAANSSLRGVLAEHPIEWLEAPVRSAVSLALVADFDRRLSAATVVIAVSPAAVASWGGVGPTAAEVVAIGPGTASALRSIDRSPAWVAEPPRAEGVVSRLAERSPGRALILCGDRARTELADGLGALGWGIDLQVVYSDRECPEVRVSPLPLAAFVVASPSAVAVLIERGPWLIDVPAVAIGPTTAAALAAAGHRAALRLAESPSDAGLAAALLAILKEPI